MCNICQKLRRRRHPEGHLFCIWRSIAAGVPDRFCPQRLSKTKLLEKQTLVRGSGATYLLLLLRIQDLAISGAYYTHGKFAWRFRTCVFVWAARGIPGNDGFVFIISLSPSPFGTERRTRRRVSWFCCFYLCSYFLPRYACTGRFLIFHTDSSFAYAIFI